MPPVVPKMRKLVVTLRVPSPFEKQKQQRAALTTHQATLTARYGPRQRMM